MNCKMISIIGRGFAERQILKMLKWPYLLNWVEYFDKGPIATFYCDVPTEKVILKGEQMHVRIWSNGPSTSLVCICRLRFFTYVWF